MIQLYNKNEITDEAKRIPEDVYDGDGETLAFLFYNLNPDILSRVFLDGILKTIDTDFVTYWVYPAGTAWINFTDPPSAGTSNIVLQGDQCLFFPGGTAQEGFLNGYGGDTVDVCFYLSNDNSAKIYTDITISPLDFVTPSEEAWVKLANSQEGLDSAVAGDSLTFPDIEDSDTLHELWVRLTVPAHYLGPDLSVLNKTDLSFAISSIERDV